MDEKIIRPVAVMRTGFKGKFGVPRQSGRAVSAKGKVVFGEEYDLSSVKYLDGFSHIWLIFGFDRTEYNGKMTVRPPRLGGNKRVGVFASRSPNRPNGLGLSCVKLDGVEYVKGRVVLNVSGADVVDGTPVYDVKPYHPSADKIDGARGGFSEREEVCGHKLQVAVSKDAENLLPPDILAAVKECVADDPRPSYISDGNRVYGMLYGGYDIKFTVNGEVAEIISAEEKDR